MHSLKVRRPVKKISGIFSCVSAPDPDWIRASLRSVNPYPYTDPDPGGQKRPTKIEES